MFQSRDEIREQAIVQANRAYQDLTSAAAHVACNPEFSQEQLGRAIEEGATADRLLGQLGETYEQAHNTSIMRWLRVSR